MDGPDNDDIYDAIPAIIIGAVQATKTEKIAQWTGHPGRNYLEELLQSSTKRIYDVLRMRKETFLMLCLWLEENTELKSTWHTAIQEQMAMFLWTINYSASSRQVIEQFQHSGETVSW